MGYMCANCAVDFPSQREVIEHMQEKHNSTFIEGDFAPLAEKLLSGKADMKSKAMQDKHKWARGD